MENKLPRNWVLLPFTEIFDINGGTQPPKAVFINAPKEGYIRLLQIRDFGKKPVPTYIPDTGKLMTCINDDILIARYGASIGRIVTGMEGSYNVALAKVSIPEKMNKNFVKWLLKSHLFQEPILSIQRTAQNGFNKTDLASIYVPLPPLAEQNRIVDKLDRLFAQLETIKTRIDYLNDIADRFTYSCLVDSKKNKFHPREKIGRFLEEGSGRIGEGWKGQRLIGVSAKEGITDLRTGQKESFEKYKIVRPGDFIYNTMRVNIGSIAIYRGSVNALTSPDYVVFRISKHLSSQLLLNFLKSDSGLLEIGANTKGSVRARLYFKALSEVRMPIAPIEIQNLAENFLKEFKNNLMTLNELKKTKLERLSRSILHKAFKGELSEQLDTDGDAGELLKQILELKNSTTKPKKVTAKKRRTILKGMRF
jgi:type I restriction enzyme S subunit